jgi:hypothetical protein
MINKLLSPAANQKAAFVTKLISALESQQSSSVNLQVIVDLAQKKLQVLHPTIILSFKSSFWLVHTWVALLIVGTWR